MSTGERTEELTALLNSATSGEKAELDRLWQAIYGEMHEIARRACNAEGARGIARTWLGRGAQQRTVPPRPSLPQSLRDGALPAEPKPGAK
jgi:hypothetical protein